MTFQSFIKYFVCPRPPTYRTQGKSVQLPICLFPSKPSLTQNLIIYPISLFEKPQTRPPKDLSLYDPDSCLQSPDPNLQLKDRIRKETDSSSGRWATGGSSPQGSKLALQIMRALELPLGWLSNYDKSLIRKRV